MKNKKIYQKLLVFAVVFFLGMLVLPNTAKAYNDYSIGYKARTTIITYTPKKNQKYYFETVFSYGDKAENFKVKLSNPKIGKVKKLKDGTFIFTPKKAGTTKVTATAYVNGKKSTCKGTIKVVKFTQPFKSFTIGGKSYRKQIKNEYNRFDLKLKKKNVNLNYKLNKGWKVKRVEDGWYDAVKIKKSYKLSKKPGRNSAIYIYLVHKKTGARVTLEVYTG